MLIKGKKKDLLSPFYEKVLDIVYKCLDSRVAAMDDLNAENFALMHAKLSSIKYDLEKYIFECLEYYVNKVDVKEGDAEFEVKVGYGFMISHLLKLQGVPVGRGSEVHSNTYLFKPSKKSKPSTTTSEASVSSSAPLQALLRRRGSER